MSPDASGTEYSLQTRLLTAVSILLFIFLGLTGIVLDRAFRSSVEAGVAEQLQVQIYVLLAAVEEEGGDFYFLQDLREPRFSQLNSGLYGLVSSPLTGEVLRTPSALEIDFENFGSFWQNLGRGENLFTRFVSPTGQEYFVAGYGVVWENGEDQYNFTVIESTGTYLLEVNRFRTSLWSWLGGVAILLLVLQLLLMRWGLSPLRRLAIDLKRIEEGDSEQLKERYPKELRAVTDNLNLLIKSERKQQLRYRETMGDLAHSLKTPLAVIAGVMQALTDRQRVLQEPELEEQVRAVDEQLERMNQIVGYQLQRAVKSNGTTALARRVDVAEVVGKIIRALDKVYAAKEMRAQVHIDKGIIFLGDERDLMEVLGNVLDNAYKYGASWLSIAARVSMEPVRQLSIVVEDDGPGISEQHQEWVLQRGARLDTLAHGQGIGLAVVTDIMSSYGGQIEVGSAANGGASIQLVFSNFQISNDDKLPT
ncbi:MAG: ATP-binding protein [Gammaproteobacteria bacterium]|nr:ATP-binding protein [Gammaproteobacteria bacterium]MDP2141905.1 ATP-binding protein [Gammaproteobacteria bacterium]MDP2347213.1 ATP-binding protein [Gammaproteobacteria bacterium]